MDENEPGAPSVGEPIRLPGIGTRVDFVDKAETPFTVVNRDDGDVEVYVGAPDGVAAVLQLDDATSHAVGALLAGRYELVPTLNDRVARVLGGLTFDWVHLADGMPAVGRTIAELRFRERTGVTIVAVLRGQVPIVAPDPDTTLTAGDDVVIMSRPADLAAGRAVLGGSP
jgi:TrkA domain protein